MHMQAPEPVIEITTLQCQPERAQSGRERHRLHEESQTLRRESVFRPLIGVAVAHGKKSQLNITVDELEQLVFGLMGQLMQTCNPGCEGHSRNSCLQPNIHM